MYLLNDQLFSSGQVSMKNNLRTFLRCLNFIEIFRRASAIGVREVVTTSENVVALIVSIYANSSVMRVIGMSNYFITPESLPKRVILERLVIH